MRDLDELARKLRDRLLEIGSLQGHGVVLSGPTGFLTKLAFVSSDIDRAFRFKDKAQAEQVREDFLETLEQFVAVELN